MASAPARCDQQLSDGAGREPRHFLVGAAGQDDRHLRAEDDPGGIRIGEERQALGEHVARLEVRHDQHIGAACDRRG